jgi:gamma-glutamylcysteine synthetase
VSSNIQSTKDSVYTQSSFEDRLSSEYQTHSLAIPHPQAAFARHETFHPRFGWIKKGFDRTCQNGKVFFDYVKYQGKVCFVFGRRSTGYFDLRALDGTKIHASASSKKLVLIQRASTSLIERNYP